MLNQQQIDFYHEQGYLHIPEIFGADEVQALRRDLDWMIADWATRSPGWDGPWRRRYMDQATETRSELIAMHDLHLYAESWMRCVTQARLCEAMGDLLGTVELHHSTMHVKPPEAGHPFPMHQDWWFYPHQDSRYVDVLVHLDDTRHENGEIRFVAGSHKRGPIPHYTAWADGTSCTPHLPLDEWPIEGTVPVPAKAGDVVIFNINTVHGSHINQTEAMRRMVRVGYRHPENQQLGGQRAGRPGLLVRGRRERQADQKPFCPSGHDPLPERVQEEWKRKYQAVALRAPALADA